MSNVQKNGRNLLWPFKLVSLRERPDCLFTLFVTMKRKGFFHPPNVMENGIRIFDSEDIEWIKFACCLRDSGMSIAEMKQFVQLVIKGDETKTERIQMLQLQIKRIEAQFEQLTRFKENIQYKIDLYSSR